MKWAILGLGLLGILAAASAALLVSSLRMASANAQTIVVSATESSEVPVLVASRTLQPMTVLDGNVVVAKSMPRNRAPVGCMTNPTDVVGKILATPMTEGEAFTTANFTASSALKQVATVIPPGMRAMAISITDYASLNGMLYPGSTVDVIASFKVKPADANGPNQNERDVTTTLLENIQVLAIEDQTVVLAPKGVLDAAENSSQRNGNQRITLLVTTHQAKALGLAMSKGTLSLALRNPLDAARGEKRDLWEESLLQDDHIDLPAPKAVIQAAAPAQRAAPQWEVQIIRNNAVQTDSFPMGH